MAHFACLLVLLFRETALGTIPGQGSVVVVVVVLFPLAGLRYSNDNDNKSFGKLSRWAVVYTTQLQYCLCTCSEVVSVIVI